MFEQCCVAEALAVIYKAVILKPLKWNSNIGFTEKY